MAREIVRAAEKRLQEYADGAVCGFNSTILHNRVHETVAGHHSTDDPLAALLDAAERAYQLDEREDIPDDVADSAFRAAETLNAEVATLVENQIARACATVVLEGDDWTDAWERSEIDDAQAEARRWLGNHLAAAERVDVLEDVRDAAVEEW